MSLGTLPEIVPFRPIGLEAEEEVMGEGMEDVEEVVVVVAERL